ncbi:hypothetical protein P2318_27005 [Myxococcaceae bacterium GXIMD 01537]
MGARIEVVEVLAFRLQVPRRALERLPAELAPELALRLAPAEDGTLVLGQEEEDSFLRFRTADDAAELTEISIINDEGGVFFQAVLGALMVRFAGDLRVRLVFNPGAPGTGEPWAEVRIDRGRTTYPGLVTQSAASNLSHAASEGGSVGAADDEASADDAPPSPEDEELALLLRKADAAWQEYQRLKRERQAS